MSNATPPAPIEAAKLRTRCDPETLRFESTDELEPIDTLIGQDRAIEAIRFGAAIDHPGYNMFALGSPGTGRHTAVHSYLEKQSAEASAPDDWVYVHNFDSEHHPQALRLPAGTAAPFCESMSELVDDLREAIPAIFQSDEYREKRNALDSELEETQEKAFVALREKAEAQDVAVLRTPMGFALAPMHEGNVIKPEVFEVLPKEQKTSIETKMEALQKELSSIMEQIPALVKHHRDNVRTLNAEFTGITVDATIKVVAEKFKEVEIIQTRLVDIREDLIEHSDLFTTQPQVEAAAMSNPDMVSHIADSRFNRYLVNVMVRNDEKGDHKGAPLVAEDHPTLVNLVGRIEHEAQYGALVTDFTMIRPGALHRANGGYLILDARKVLLEMFSWEALKRALRADTINISTAAGQLGLVSTVSLEPEPIPLKVKVVLIGERILYYLLSSLDPEFSELFKVEVDFDEELVRSDEYQGLYARLIAAIAKKEKLRSLNAAGVARVIEEVARLAEDADRMSLNIGLLADLLREADFWAGDNNKKQITDTDVDRAVAEKIYRADRVRERHQELIEHGTILINTDGELTGQINGLSVLTLGNYRFGQPSRITARVRMGSGKVVDIERETKLGGPIHSKGVLILSSYLAATYARDVPVSLWGSIVFEQSYGGVDGDSASSAELYALLSALSGIPIRQYFAVTGSVNQYGQVQAIGGVNEKIEGFFDICRARGLTGTQGVLIPAANIKHLMLRNDVVAAASEGKFRIFPVETIDQGIELLTGISASDRNSEGTYPAQSINGLVEETLHQYAETRKRFSEDSSESPTNSSNDS